MARTYTNLHTATTLSGAINSSVTTIPLTSLAGLPVTYPYNLILELGTAQIEVVRVDATAGGSNLTVVRGQDGTTAQAHNAGATVVHGIVAQDVQEPQDHMAASTNVHGLAGGAAVVGTTTTQTLTNKTISGSANTLTNIPNSALVAIDAAKVTLPFTSLSTGTLSTTGNATVGGTLGITGTTTAAAVNATNVTASGTLGVTGNATVGGTLGITGTTTAGVLNSGNHTITGNATVSGTLGITGTTTAGVLNSGNHAVTGTLSTSGLATLNSASVTGNATVGGTLGITGATTAAAVTGTTINGTTDVQQNSRTLPRGIIGGKKYAQAGALATNISSEALANMDTGSITYEAGRRYRVHLHLRLSAATVGYVLVRLRDTNLAGASVWAAAIYIPTTSLALDIYQAVDLVPGAVTKTYVVTGQNGSVNVYFNANAGGDNLAAVFVEDVGSSSGVTTVP